MRSLYLLVDLLAVAIPLALSWHPRIRFNEKWRAFWPACLIVAAAFIAWDVVFTVRGVWGFDPRYLIGASFAELPIEEWLFFICIPYACVFTYHTTINFRLPESTRFARIIVLGILVVAIVIAAVSVGRIYTVVVQSATVVMASYLLWRKPPWLNRFLVGFALILVPFVLTNGVLTGVRFFRAPAWNLHPEMIVDHIVWYDNIHTLGARLFTIPVEDVFYAFLLIGLNVILFERFDKRSSTAR